ncbi:uncharacterized protein F5147DRAFT_834123 [Suillus discolor]|uniref:DUF6534 domain-containing protein n=1 Tax=Suillus discolor TaxID=1912936 RepID=A0A9P7FEJ4_9AGAM|nr:uncharacterized protein F5147DRAFT_834123 [Suillus discolor]KAG2116025.1 hypothetical protein F5147DRAFT_834123 [Suillus discolor]
MSVNAVADAGDVLIAAYLCTFFQNFRTGFRRPDTVPDKLIPLTISNGLLISVCASFISISVWPDTFIYIAALPSMSVWVVGINHVTGSPQRASAAIFFWYERVARVRFADHNNISIKLDAMRQFAPNENSSALDLLKL